MPQVHVIGEILGATGFERKGIYCTYEFSFDNEKWRVVEGDVAGRSWIAVRHEEEPFAIWNQPVNISFSSVSVLGWPRIKVEVYEIDDYDRTILGGYGFVYVPVAPGRHKLQCYIARPRGSLLEEVNGAFLGGHNRYLEPNAVMSPKSRQGHATLSRGVVHLDFHIAVKDFNKEVLLCTPANQTESCSLGEEEEMMLVPEGR